MSMQSEGKDAKGRNYDQITRDGTSSAGSMGTGGTGDIGAMPQEGGRQSASRSDDLLAGDTTDQEADQAFGGSRGGRVQTGMEGIARTGAAPGGNRQSGQQGGQRGDQNRQGADGAIDAGTTGTDGDQYDQGTAAPER